MTVIQAGALWRDDGHLTLDAVTAAADGQLGDGEAQVHLHGCDHCLRAVGEAALLTSDVADMLASLRQEETLRALGAPATRRRLSPVAAIAMSTAMAVLAFVTGRLSVSGGDDGPQGSGSNDLGLMVSSATHLQLRAPELAAPAWPSLSRDCLNLELPQ